MVDRMFFLSLILRAMQQPNHNAALRDAFRQIQTKGHQPEFAEGYRQFRAFMREVAKQHAKGQLDDTTSPAVGSPASDAEELPPELLQALNEAAERPLSLELLVKREDVVVGTFPVDRLREGQTITGVVPGYYELILDTGLQLWEGRLSDRDLVWRMAFPDRPLAMAADTDQTERAATRQLDLLEGTLLVAIHPGIEDGTISIRLQQGETNAI